LKALSGLTREVLASGFGVAVYTAWCLVAAIAFKTPVTDQSYTVPACDGFSRVIEVDASISDPNEAHQDYLRRNPGYAECMRASARFDQLNPNGPRRYVVLGLLALASFRMTRSVPWMLLAGAGLGGVLVAIDVTATIGLMVVLAWWVGGVAGSVHRRWRKRSEGGLAA